MAVVLLPQGYGYSTTKFKIHPTIYMAFTEDMNTIS